MKVHKGSDCASTGGGCGWAFPYTKSLKFFSASIDCITYSFTLFNINFAFCHIQKLKIALLS